MKLFHETCIFFHKANKNIQLKNNPTKYKIDIPIEIPAKGFALFWCDNQTVQGIYHTTFKIKNAPNEFIGLYNLKKNQFEDSIKHPNVAKNKSYGRSSDGHQDWIVFNIPTPNATNEWIDEEEAPNERLFLYPNPNSTSVLFASQEISGTIFSMSGRIVGSIHQTQIIPINHLSSGIYIIKTDTNKVMKFVVIRP